MTDVWMANNNAAVILDFYPGSQSLPSTMSISFQSPQEVLAKDKKQIKDQEKKMILMEKLRNEVRARRVPPIFSSSDLQNANIEDPNNNLSNYDKKNKGSLNTKVLVSREINGETFYTFDEQLFD